MLPLQVYYLLAQVYFGMLDALLASEDLPEEYRDRCQVNLEATFLIGPLTSYWNN